MGPHGSGEAAWAKEVAISTFNRVGAPVAHHKTEGPSPFLTFLGMQIDTASLSTQSSSGESGSLTAAIRCVDTEEKLYTEGPRIPVGSSFTCSHSDLSRAHFSSSIVLVALGGLKTFLLHSPECSRTSGSGMVALFNSSLEWSLLLPICPASPTCVLRRLWLFWVQSILSGTKPVVPAPVATILVRHWHSSKGTCSSF